MRKVIKQFLKDESGQTSTEYILLVALVAIIVIKFGGTARERLLELTDKVFKGAGDIVDRELSSQ